MDLLAGRSPAPASLATGIDDSGEPELTLVTRWNPAPAHDFRRIPEARLFYRAGRVYNRHAVSGVAVPGDPALARHLADFVPPTPTWRSTRRPARSSASWWRSTTGPRRSCRSPTPTTLRCSSGCSSAASSPLQRAGVQYALARRRTFIADEQGLGKTVQALACWRRTTFPAVVICPASMKLMWERESLKWLPDRSVEVLAGRADEAWPESAADADLVVLNYDILEAHVDRLIALGPRAVVFDESHYVKNPQAGRTKAALELAAALPPAALRLALTGTPILNRAEELVTQPRVLDRLREFGSGAA